MTDVGSDPVTAIMVGAGHRGFFSYGPYATFFPDELRFVAVADPIEARRERFAEAHAIGPERRFETWEEALADDRYADAVFVCTPDRLHREPTVAAVERGYDVFLEKPMADTLEGCRAVVDAAERTGRLVHVAHVLRYTAFFRAVHEIVAGGRLGDVVSVSHRENVAFWHFAHSYVRGNWRTTKEAPPMIVAKACHDLDLLHWNLAAPVVRLTSAGSLTEFRPERAPPGSTARCTDGCPVVDCLYDARRLYLQPQAVWPAVTIADDLTVEGRHRALETGPYGRCVWRCDNDVVDHQSVDMELADGATVSLVVTGHSDVEERTMRYDGTAAVLRGRFGPLPELTVSDKRTGATETVPIEAAASGHGGGDFGAVRAFLRAVRGIEPSSSTAAEALPSHTLAFAAEASRLGGAPVVFDV